MSHKALHVLLQRPSIGVVARVSAKRLALKQTDGHIQIYQVMTYHRGDYSGGFKSDENFGMGIQRISFNS